MTHQDIALALFAIQFTLQKLTDLDHTPSGLFDTRRELEALADKLEREALTQ